MEIFDKDASSLEEAEQCTILIKDANDSDKIISVLNQYQDLNELSNIISDLLSFAHFFFYNQSNYYENRK